MTTQGALIALLNFPDLSATPKDKNKLQAKIVELLIKAQELENKKAQLLNEEISSQLEYAKILRQHEVDNLYEDNEVDHND